MGNGIVVRCSKRAQNQVHDELLRDDPELNLAWKHASGGRLFHSRLIGATARHSRKSQGDSANNQIVCSLDRLQQI